VSASIEGHTVEFVLRPDRMRRPADRARERIGATASVARDDDVDVHNRAGEERVAYRIADEVGVGTLFARPR